MGFFKWFHFSNFLDTYQEWHALVEGFSESFCFWRAHIEPSEELLNDIKGEHHYYVFGRVIGFVVLIISLAIVVKYIAGRTKS